MTTFIVVAALMALAALAAVLWPLLARAPAGRRVTLALIPAVALPIVAGGLYVILSDWNWNPPLAAQPQEQTQVPPAVLQMVARLEERMKSDPDNLNGWVMLGRSYFQLNRYADAEKAYQRAYTLSRGTNAEAVLGLGEAMMFADQSTTMGPAAELFQQGFELAPGNPKALWYTGLIAHRQGNLAVTRERWGKLMDTDLPPNAKEELRGVLDEIDSQLKPKSPAP